VDKEKGHRITMALVSVYNLVQEIKETACFQTVALAFYTFSSVLILPFLMDIFMNKL